MNLQWHWKNSWHRQIFRSPHLSLKALWANEILHEQEEVHVVEVNSGATHADGLKTFSQVTWTLRGQWGISGHGKEQFLMPGTGQMDLVLLWGGCEAIVPLLRGQVVSEAAHTKRGAHLGYRVSKRWLVDDFWYPPQLEFGLANGFLH